MRDYARLTDKELLAQLIGVRETHKLYQGRLGPLFDEGSSAHEKCTMARELVRRWLTEELRTTSCLSSPALVREFLQVLLSDRQHEVFVALWLDAQHRVVKADEMFRGTLTQTSVYPREVVKAALKQNAAAVIFAHNHPSGVAEPSRADELLTRRLRDALTLVEVNVLDHFVVAGNRTLSFAERGLL